MTNLFMCIFCMEIYHVGKSSGYLIFWHQVINRISMEIENIKKIVSNHLLDNFSNHQTTVQLILQ